MRTRIRSSPSRCLFSATRPWSLRDPRANPPLLLLPSRGRTRLLCRVEAAVGGGREGHVRGRELLDLGVLVRPLGEALRPDDLALEIRLAEGAPPGAGR